MATDTPMSVQRQAADGRGRLFLIGFFLVFLLVGLGVFYAMLVRPVMRILEARSWPVVPCTVLSSEVKQHSSEDGPTYSLNILYAYEVGGRQYRANRYHFMGGSSSGQEGKAAVVRRYPPGQKSVCYVNPRDPTEAVLERGFTADLWFGLLPLVFVAVGAGGVLFALRAKPKEPTAAPGALAGSEAVAQALPGAGESAALPKNLKAGISPLAKLVGAVLVALFWNGLLSIFLTIAVRSWVRQKPEWVLTIFLIPFVLVGLALIAFVIRTVLALFNPRPNLTVTPGAVALGVPLQIQWELIGRTGAITRLRILLEGREEARYRRGTRTSTDTSVFTSIEVANTTDRLTLQRGQARLLIPAGLMHSWAAENNKIVWVVKVRGAIEWWPDVDEEFPLTVLPQPQSASQPT